MKKIILTFLLSAVPLLAQETATTSPTNTSQQQELQRQFDELKAHADLDYEKLRGLTEFQEYVDLQQRMVKLQQQYQALAAEAAIRSHKSPAPEKK